MNKGIIFAFAAAASWGLVYVLEQKTLAQFSVAKFIVYQSIFMGSLALIVVLFIPQHNGTLSLPDWKVIFHPTFLF